MGSLKKRASFNLLTRFLNSRSSPLFHFTTTRSLETLAFEEVLSSPDKPYNYTAFILHGLLGSGRNWRSFSRNLASTLSTASPSSEWRMVLVDLRNHGKSAEVARMEPPHDMFNTAKDLADLVKGRGWDWPDVVIGHSLAGKVALQFALSCENGDYGESGKLPKQLWVLDSIPGEVSPENGVRETEKVLKTLQSLPSSIPSQRWLVNHMLELGFSKSLSEWIGSNLKKTGEVETWGFDLEAAIKMLNSYRDTSYWSLLEHPPKGTEIGIVVAEKSGRCGPDDIRRLESLSRQRGDESEGNVTLYVLPNSGHWVHVDNPKGLVKIVAPRIHSLTS